MPHDGRCSTWGDRKTLTGSAVTLLGETPRPHCLPHALFPIRFILYQRNPLSNFVAPLTDLLYLEESAKEQPAC